MTPIDIDLGPEAGLTKSKQLLRDTFRRLQIRIQERIRKSPGRDGWMADEEKERVTPNYADGSSSHNKRMIGQ